jgi:heterodisulfide reductase subunit A-like polyferredoxin
LTGHAGKFAFTILKSTGDKTDLKAGAVVIATGAEEYTPASYGYGTSKAIVTQSELEDLIHSDDGRLSRSNSAVMIQCVESRDEQRQYCSRVCCGQALKNSLALKEKSSGMAVTVLYRDIMSYGFQEEFYTMAREKGVLFLRHDL